MENFEQTLENNPSLNKLITNEEISMMTKFKKQENLVLNLLIG